MLEVVVKIVQPLTTKQVKELPIGVHNVGGVVGLCIRKQVTTSRYFLRYLWSKKTYLLNLPRGIGLGEARKIAFEYRRQLEQGVNPKIQLVQHLEEVALELAIKVKTFSDVAQEWIEYRDEMGYWNTREKVLVVVKGRLEKYIYPVIGSKKITEVDAYDISKILLPVYTSRSMCSKVKTLLNNIFKWSCLKNYRTSNPVDDAHELMTPLDIKHKEVRNQPSLDYREVPSFMTDLLERRDNASLMLAFSILTCARSKAVRMMKWDEIDFANQVWTIPEEHDKVKGEGRFRTIMLNPQSIEILSLMKDQRTGTDDEYVFSNGRGGFYSDTQFISHIKKLHESKFAVDGIGWVDRKTGLRITQHGFRSSFKTWSLSDELGNNKKYDREVVEYCLLHSKQDRYKNAYDRCDFERDRSEVMKDWGEWCAGKSNVKQE